MIEMVVRGVERCPRSGKLVAIVEPRVAETYPRLALAVTMGEAHALIHEMRAQDTLRAQAFALLARVLTGFQGKVTAIEIVPANDGQAAAQLRLECPSGGFFVPIEVGQAIGLAVRLRLPLMTTEGLFRALGADERTPSVNERTPNADGSSDVPRAFRRAFAD